jgi:hypothetical protein
MEKKLLVLLFSLASLGLVSCGGGNDVASSGASAVSAAAAPSAVSKPATPTTEAKVNGQVDERTGVAPVVAKMTVAPNVAACNASKSFGGTGPLLTATTNPSYFVCMALMMATENEFVYVN